MSLEIAKGHRDQVTTGQAFCLAHETRRTAVRKSLAGTRPSRERRIGKIDFTCCLLFLHRRTTAHSRAGHQRWVPRLTPAGPSVPMCPSQLYAQWPGQNCALG